MSGDAGTDSDAPWAMQLAARVERADPPPVADLCAAAVCAVIGLLDDERAAEGGPWAEPLARWQREGRIRKLVRRARGSAWERAQRPDGLTASHRLGEVRAYVPSPMDQLPEAVAKLQIRSTDLAEPAVIDQLPPSLAGLVVAVTPLIDMSWGKQAAQCAHGGQLLWRDAPMSTRRALADGSCQVTVIHPSAELWFDLVATASVRVNDGGFTEVPAGTNTAIGWFEDA